MNCLPLSCGFKVLLIASILYSCTPWSTTISNTKLISSDNFGIPDEWELVNISNFEMSNYSIDSSEGGVILSSTVAGNVLLSQKIMLDSGNYFLLAKYNAEVEKGAFFVRAKDINSIEVRGLEETCTRTLFTLAVKNFENVNIEFGFEPGSIGTAVVEEIFIIKVQYNYPSIERTIGLKNQISNKLGIVLQQNSFLDRNIDSLASSLNAAFLSNNYHLKTDMIMAFSGEVFNEEITPYLNKFILDIENRDSYCQKSSLSLDELIRSYNIPTRQLHWQRDCSGIHQFLEYWNAHDQLWKIIDPFYGIRYIDGNGNYLNFEGVEKLVRSNKFSKDNIKKEDIGRLYYSEKEILDGWLKSDLAVHVRNNIRD